MADARRPDPPWKDLERTDISCEQEQPADFCGPRLARQFGQLRLPGTAPCGVDGNVLHGGRHGRPRDERPSVEKRGGDVGLLTLFEWYGSHEVGKRLKCPSTPTWVICSESHFSVLFGLAEPRRAGASFAGDLLYYDGLHRQDRLLRLTLSPSPTGGHTQRIGRTAEERARFADHGREAVPPLEFVLETKWQGVDVDWNGAEKIL